MIVVKNKFVVFLLFFLMPLSSLVLPISNSLALQENPAILVVVEPKIELIGVLSLLSQVDDYFACERLNTVIKRDTVAWFRPFKDKQAVKSFIRLINQDQTENTLRKFLLELGDLPDLSIPETLSLEYQNETFTAFRNDLVSFCHDTNFLTFWSREKEYYSQMIDEFILECNVYDTLNQTFAFLGVNNISCRFVLSPLMMENQVLLLDLLSQKKGIIILGLTDIQNGRLLFGSNKTHLKLVKKDLLKEVVASITKPYESDINLSIPLMLPIQEKMKSFHINSWQDCFNHHLALSIEVLCFEDNQPEKLDELKKLGFIYIGESYDLLNQYNRYRMYYPSLKSFLPRILDQFEAITRRKH